MNTVRFVKSFSKGQITIPKEFRNAFGVRDEFWMKLSLVGGKIIVELVDKGKGKEGYTQRLLSIKGDWFSRKAVEKNRAEVEKRMLRYSMSSI